jgi:beta-phosphoglucomutase-like phosphatase (HAD superfamily)
MLSNLDKGNCFDSDGVLVDSMSSHYKAWKIAFKEVSILTKIEGQSIC